MTRIRARRLGALSTAAALLLGVSVAVSAPATAAATLDVVNVTDHTDGNGVRHIFGEVVNNGPVPVAPQIDIALFDASGAPQGAEVGISLVAVLAPNGGRAPFEAQPADAYDHAVVTASPADPTPVYNHALTLTRKAQFVDPTTRARQITLGVQNNNSSRADGVSIAYTFYDAAGGVVWAETVGVSPLAGGAATDALEPVNSLAPPYATWRAIAESASAPSGDGAEPPAATGTAGDTTTTLTCNPKLRLSSTTVNVGRTTTATMTGGTPGSKVTLEGYSRPSTQYASIRKEVTVAPDGTIAPIAVRPPTSARVRMQVAGCSTPGTGQVISVIPGLGIAVARIGTRTYRFSGKIIPGKQNTGRSISLYVASGTGAAVKKAAVKSAADGAYGVNVLLPKGAVKVYWATGADMTNLAGKSAVKAFTTS